MKFGQVIKEGFFSKLKNKLKYARNELVNFQGYATTGEQITFDPTEMAKDNEK